LVWLSVQEVVPLVVRWWWPVALEAWLMVVGFVEVVVDVAGHGDVVNPESTGAVGLVECELKQRVVWP
jgi:hypothetical protein